MPGNDDRDRQGLPSPELVAAAVEKERDRQAGHAESLDSKAGILLGFAGVVIALRGLGRNSLWSTVGVLLTVLAAASSVMAFAPRPFAVLEVRHLRNHYLRAAQAFTRLTLLDTEIEIMEATATLVRRKARFLLIGLVLLLLGIACIAIGILASELREAFHG
jgi:uncharacterized membrane protein